MYSTFRRIRQVLAAAAAAAIVTTIGSPAHAAPFYNFEYDASGTSHIASTGSSIALGPATLYNTMDVANGQFSGGMSLPGTSTRFEVAGFIPVTAKVDFIEAAPLTGQVHFDRLKTPVTTTSSYHIKLSNIKIVGFPTITGNNCRTKVPVTIEANTPEGESFALLGGGRLVGEYSIGDFQNCGLNTWLINLLIPGGGNTVEFNVSNGRFA